MDQDNGLNYREAYALHNFSQIWFCYNYILVWIKWIYTIQIKSKLLTIDPSTHNKKSNQVTSYKVDGIWTRLKSKSKNIFFALLFQWPHDLFIHKK
jgi:hypothetical protein